MFGSGANVVSNTAILRSKNVIFHMSRNKRLYENRCSRHIRKCPPICEYVCVCVCVYVWVGVGERVKVRGFVSLSILLSVCVGWSALL